MSTEHREGTQDQGTLCGCKLYANPALLTIHKVEPVRRTWRERLLSWPWKPWVAERLEITMAPDPNLYRAGAVIVGHPETIKAATAHLAAQAAGGADHARTVH